MARLPARRPGRCRVRAGDPASPVAERSARAARWRRGRVAGGARPAPSWGCGARAGPLARAGPDRRLGDAERVGRAARARPPARPRRLAAPRPPPGTGTGPLGARSGPAGEPRDRAVAVRRRRSRRAGGGRAARGRDRAVRWCAGGAPRRQRPARARPRRTRRVEAAGAGARGARPGPSLAPGSAPALRRGAARRWHGVPVGPADPGSGARRDRCRRVCRVGRRRRRRAVASGAAAALRRPRAIRDRGGRSACRRTACRRPGRRRGERDRRRFVCADLRAWRCRRRRRRRGAARRGPRVGGAARGARARADASAVRPGGERVGVRARGRPDTPRRGPGGGPAAGARHSDPQLRSGAGRVPRLGPAPPPRRAGGRRRLRLERRLGRTGALVRRTPR